MGASDSRTRTKRLTLLAASGATALLLLDVTAVNVALPSIEHGLRASLGELQWVIDAYALTLAVVLLSTGALADRHGRKRIFLAGTALFAAASLICGVAPNPVVLDFARAIQGIGGAAMFSCSLAILANQFSGPARGRALGIWGAVTGAALALGPLVGGVLVDAAGWRWIFLINIPLCAILLAITRAGVVESKSEEAPAFDLAGTSAFTLGAFLTVFALIRGNEEGWGSALIITCFSVGGVLLVAFVGIQLRSKTPMLNPSYFRIRAFTGTAIVAFAQSFALYPLFLFIAIYFQDVLHFTPTQTGLRLLPLTVALFVIAPISGSFTSKVQLRYLLSLGLTLIGLGLLLMTKVEPASDWTALLPGFLVGGVGIGVISPSLAAAMVGVLSEEKTGLASGVNNTFRQLGIAVGIAVLGAIFQAQVGGGPNAVISGSGRQAFTSALSDIFAVAAVVAFAAVPLTLWLVRQRDMQGIS